MVAHPQIFNFGKKAGQHFSLHTHLTRPNNACTATHILPCPADVLSPAELEAYLPSGRWGNILITSHNSTMQSLTLPEISLEVTEMEENDAIELFLKASYLDPHAMDFQTEASKIVKELSYLPLAIDQAGAYIASGATTIGNYLAKYFEH